MKKFGMKISDMKEAIKDIPDDMEVFITNSVNTCGNISELCEVRKDTYCFFGVSIPCIILGSAQNTDFPEEE